jgi:hypothetical protein
VKRRLGVVVVVLAVTFAAAGAALAHDCIRVSSSLQGLQQSAGNSGNWGLFDLSSGAAFQQSLAALNEQVSLQDATCASDAYKAADGGTLPLYFALGLGVAGPNGVLVHNNPNDSVLGNLKGIDHLDDSPIGAALFAAAGACNIPTG